MDFVGCALLDELGEVAGFDLSIRLDLHSLGEIATSNE